MTMNRRLQFPNTADLAAFVDDHASEDWFVDEVLDRYAHMLPQSYINGQTGMREYIGKFDEDVFVLRHGPAVAEQLFDEDVIDWAPEVSPVDGKPYMERKNA